MMRPGMLGAGMGGFGMGGWGFGGGLNLTDQQQHDLQQLHDTHRTAMIQMWEQFSDAQRAMEDLLLRDNPDQTTVTAGIAEVNRLRDKLATSHVNTCLQVLQTILTPEQRARLHERRQAWHDQRGVNESAVCGFESHSAAP
ncbi:MAG: periplasmic heavy metal sensor [Candidatus Tectomicrobia bacterium]|nr:periplasmic heavy metal sensor [Candidatus Tectomicrobia bacterium]